MGANDRLIWAGHQWQVTLPSANMMKNTSLLLGLLIMAGCTMPNESRYQIGPPAAVGGGARPGATPADQEAVKEILQTVAAPLKLKDMTSVSLVPNVIVYYQEIDSNNPVKLIAWSEGDKIFIEMSHWPEEIGETRPYRSTREYIETELKRKFGDRSSVVAFKKLVERTAKPQ